MMSDKLRVCDMPPIFAALGIDGCQTNLDARLLAGRMLLSLQEKGLINIAIFRDGKRRIILSDSLGIMKIMAEVE